MRVVLVEWVVVRLRQMRLAIFVLKTLIYLLHEMGIETGIDLDKLISIAQNVENLVGHKLAWSSNESWA